MQCVTFEMVARHPGVRKAIEYEPGVQKRGRGQNAGIY